MNKALSILLFVLILPAFALAQEEMTDSTISQYLQRELPEYNLDSSRIKHIPETHVQMAPPEHFIFSSEIPGFIHPGSSTSIQIQEVEGTNYVMIDRVMTEEHFESQDVELISREEVTTNTGYDGVIYTVRFEVKGVKYERMMLFAGDYNNTMWINANYPIVSKKLVYEPVRNSILSASLTENKSHE